MTISSASTSSTAGKGCATLFFSVFAIMGVVFTGLVAKAGFDTVRTYFWDKTDCVIEASAAREKGDSFDLDVRYAYRFNGRPYTGTRFNVGMTSSMDAGTAQRAAQRYAPGSHVVCYVNPSSPGESTLERGAPWILLFILIPLVFVVVGVGGIVGVWRTKPDRERPVSERRRTGRMGAFGLRLFGLVFICVGGGLVYAMLIRPMMMEAAAAKWPQVPCEIISSHVRLHSGSKGNTYSVDIRYRYTFDRRDYTGMRYNFETGSSSSRGWRAEVVKNFPPGLKTLCYVNPLDPIEAVLSVKPSPDRWFGLIPSVFLIAGFLVFLNAPALSRQNASSTGIPSDGLPLLPRDLSTGEVELKPASSPLAGFIILLLVALFWNGITWAILLNMESGAMFPRIFLGIFALIGAALGAGVLYQFLALFNPRPILTASAPAVPLGGTLDVRWRFTGNVRRLARLRISLEGREEATYRRGTTTTTDRNVFAKLVLADTADRAQMTGGSAKVVIPRELIHTFTAPSNKIIWTVRLIGDIPKWPDVGAEFPITVLPREAATLFREQAPPS